MQPKQKHIRCATAFCKNKAKKGTLCGSCKNKKYRLNNPIRYSYMTLRDNSKRRGVFFDLSFEQFKQFCFETDYIRGKGKTKKSYSIDRIKENKNIGYTISNIQILTLQNNTLKRWNKLEYDWQTKSVAVTSNRTEQNRTEQNTITNPF